MTPDVQDADTVPMILVVDDDLSVRNSIKFSLEVEGFAVRVYADAGALLDATDLPARGCLVVDDDLRDMSGLELLAMLRRRTPRWPAVLVTSHPSAAVRDPRRLDRRGDGGEAAARRRPGGRGAQRRRARTLTSDPSP